MPEREVLSQRESHQLLGQLHAQTKEVVGSRASGPHFGIVPGCRHPEAYLWLASDLPGAADNGKSPRPEN